MLRHLPNLITALRIALVVPLCLLILAQRWPQALAVAALAGVSDALDGLLARRFGWRSWLGGMLDPLADKLLLTAAFVTLALVGVIPMWLTALIVGRDLVIVVGAIAYHALIGRFDAAPTRLSKWTTVVQIVFVLYELQRAAGWLPEADGLNDALIALTAALTLASGRDLAEGCYAANMTADGRWSIGGTIVDPAALACPTLAIASTTDRIVPAAATPPADERIDLALGHVGMMIGSRAEAALWRGLSDWLSRHGG